MPLELFRELVDDICNSRFDVAQFDFEGEGEPLMNRDVWKMVSYAREHFPQSHIKLTTNGNFDYNDDSVHAGLSRLEFSVDGYFQDSYEIYRRKGDIDKAFGFMEQFAKAKKRCGKNTELVWKYLLFGHNDSDSELIEAQKKAMELGVDSLLFYPTPLVTAPCKHSRFFKKEKMANFPRIDTGGSSLRIDLIEESGAAGDYRASIYRNKLALFAVKLFGLLTRKLR
jgi:hypothetical protein